MSTETNTHIVTLCGEPVIQITQESEGKPHVLTGRRESAIKYTEAEAEMVVEWLGRGAAAEPINE